MLKTPSEESASRGPAGVRVSSLCVHPLPVGGQRTRIAERSALHAQQEQPAVTDFWVAANPCSCRIGICSAILCSASCCNAADSPAAMTMSVVDGAGGSVTDSDDEADADQVPLFMWQALGDLGAPVAAAVAMQADDVEP